MYIHIYNNVCVYIYIYIYIYIYKVSVCLVLKRCVHFIEVVTIRVKRNIDLDNANKREHNFFPRFLLIFTCVSKKKSKKKKIQSAIREQRSRLWKKSENERAYYIMRRMVAPSLDKTSHST